MSWLAKLNIAGLWNNGTPEPISDTNKMPVNDSAVLAALVNRYGGGKSSAADTYTTATTSTLITPASGNYLEVYWVSAINRSPNVSFPAVTIELGSETIYKSSAISHWELFVGGVDETLDVTLSDAGLVDVTVHYKEVTP